MDFARVLNMRMRLRRSSALLAASRNRGVIDAPVKGFTKERVAALRTRPDASKTA